ncbi:MAG: peptidylprolyl isomerase, partial [Bacteroidales bacterium]|nr:peptidylprolyl isomerase [Bacteroidales bacterium]
PWFRAGRMGMVPEFEEAAFKLEKPGDYTEPVKTSYSWHIIMLLEKRGLGKYEDLKADIKTKISRDARASKSRQAVIEKLKKEYNFKENPKALAEFNKVVDESIIKNEWSLDKAKNLNKTMFSFAGMEINQKEFAEYIHKKQGKKVSSVKEFVDQNYERFIDEKVSKYEEDRLEEKYPDFKYLMKEYHDGILLFELTDQLVWSKAVKDTIGLQDFYNKNRDNYMWPERVDATIYYCKDLETKQAVEKLLKKKAKKGYTNDDILKVINIGEEKRLRIESGIYAQGENRAADHFAWNLFPENEISKVMKREYIYEGKIIPPSHKTLDESKGLVTADYQEYLEKEWIKELRNNYKITVNKNILKTVK